MNLILEKVEQCPICSDKSSKLWKQIDRWEIRQCSGCGLKRLDPRPVESELAKLYDKSYFQERTAQDSKKASQQMARSFKRRMNVVLRYSNGKKLLDAGCGEGNWLSYAQNHGFDVTGFDISEEAAKQAKFPIITGPMCKAPIMGMFDVITSFHSLEHTQNPVAALNWLSNFLNPDGILLVEVPNCGGYDAQHYDAKWDGWKLPFHFWHFDKDTLSEALIKTGFKPIFWRFDSSKYLRERLRKIPILSLTKGLLGHLKTGTGMLAVSKKSNIL